MTENPLEAEGDIAADYLEGLLDIIDVDGDLEMDVENGRAMVAIVGEDLYELVGDGGEVLDALQDLARLAVMRETGHRSRLMLDVGGYRAALRKELTDQGTRAVDEVKRTGESVSLPPMMPWPRLVWSVSPAAKSPTGTWWFCPPDVSRGTPSGLSGTAGDDRCGVGAHRPPRGRSLVGTAHRQLPGGDRGP